MTSNPDRVATQSGVSPHTPGPSERAQLPPPSNDHRPSRWARLILENIALALAYALTGMLALQLAHGTVLASPVWPAAGIAFALVFVRGSGYLPGIVLGSLVTNLPTLLRAHAADGVVLAVSLSVAISTALGIFVGANIVRRTVGAQPRLISGRQILLFMTVAGPITGAVSASIGAAVLLVSGFLAPNQMMLSWFTGWVGETLGIVVFAPITMMMLPEQHTVWAGRRWKIAVPSIVALGLIVFGLVESARAVVVQRTAAFRQEAYDAIESLDSRLTSHKEMLAAIVSLQSAKQLLSREDFAIFTRPFLERHLALQALSWNPVIKAEQRSAYEAAQRTHPVLSNFRIMERNTAGELVPAGDRPEFVPVGYIEPMATNQVALGFDVYSNPVRADAINRARRVGLIQVTAPIELVQDQSKQVGVLMFMAAKNAAGVVSGFAAGAYRMHDLLVGSLRHTRWQSWNFVLTDTTDPDNPLPLAERLVDGTPAPRANPDSVSVSRSLVMGGRSWTLQAWPNEALLASLPAPIPILLMTAMLLIATLLEVFLLLVTGMEFQWRIHAANSSYKATHDDLTGMLNRRGLFDRLRSMQKAREALHSTTPSPYTHVLMFLDLDRFKQVNDGAGHDAGDAMLCKVTEAIHSATRQGDCIARIGGDEFVILAPDCTLERGRQIAADIQHAITAASIEWNGVTYSVGASIGVTEIVATSSMSIDDLMRQADAACYAAKHGGRNTVQTFAPT